MCSKNTTSFGGTKNKRPDESPKQPSVSIVIPVFNGAEFIERTVRSAAAQTYKNTEILVINDGSNDATENIVDRLSREIPHLRRVDTKNQGVARARNLGTEISDSDYVAYLDADDLWHPLKIEAQVAALARHSDDPSWVACYTYHRVIDQNDRLLNNGFRHRARGAFFGSHLVENHVGNGSSLLVRRSTAIAVGGFDPDYADRGIGGCEDMDFQLRVLQRYKIELVPQYLVGYRSHPNAMSENTYAMTEGYAEVREKFATDARVSSDLRRASSVAVHRYQWQKHLRSRNYSTAAQVIAAQFRLAPRATISDLWYLGGRKLFRKLAAKVKKLGREDVAAAPQPLFSSFAPTDGLTVPQSKRERQRSRQHERIDREFNNAS